MKKNGFVSTSLIYTFFVIFLLLMVFLLHSYSRIRFLLEDYRYDIKDSFASADGADINLYIMVWNRVTQEYELTDTLPPYGYKFIDGSEGKIGSYCKNGSTITYQNGNVSVSANRKDYCYAYFEEVDKDIKLNIYTKESKDGEKELVQNIPSRNYEFTDYTCTNGATLTFDSTKRKFKIVSSNKTVCDVEFTKKEIDIIINLYKESSNGNHEYNGLKFLKTEEVPGINYTFHSYVCKNNKTNISIVDGKISVEANGKDECKLYYTGGNDKVELLIMQETEIGVSGFTTGKKYSRVYQSPGTGYTYVGYLCDSDKAKVIYQNGYFIGESTEQTICRVYFNVYDENNALINYYLGKSSGEYELVSSVPEVGYKFNASKSNCQNGSSYKVNNNYVVVNAITSKEKCDFYYDITEADVKVLVYVLNRETEKYELGNVPVVGYNMHSAGCTNSGSIEYKNSELIVTSEGPTVCTVYFR